MSKSVRRARGGAHVCLSLLGWLSCSSSPHDTRAPDASPNGGGGGAFDGGPSTVDMSDGAPPSTDAGTPSAEAGGAVILPVTPAGDALAWLLGLLAGPPAAITQGAVISHFSGAFLQQIPAATLVSTLMDFASALSPATLRQIESSSPAAPPSQPVATVAAIVETGSHLFVRITLVASAPSSADTAPPIEGLLFAPAPEYDLPLRDPAVLDARLGDVAPAARLLIARLDGGACVPVHALAADESMPLGSMFKLYVLGALAADVAAGRTAWTDPVTIEEQWKSLPSGVLQDQPSGTMLPVSEVAGKMISISDNTAADHLIRLVGRERVEAYQVAMGHSNPALNIPFLTTRELFQLKIAASAAERATYLEAQPADRRALLDNDYDQRPLPALAAALAFTAPVEIDRLEWFASPSDLCRAFATLKQAAEQPNGGPVATILSMNPGLPIDPLTFSFIGFKGGSEPGVLALGWLLHRIADDAWMVVTLGFADPDNPIDEDLGAYYALAAVQMAGR